MNEEITVLEAIGMAAVGVLGILIFVWFIWAWERLCLHHDRMFELLRRVAALERKEAKREDD